MEFGDYFYGIIDLVLIKKVLSKIIMVSKRTDRIFMVGGIRIIRIRTNSEFGNYR